MALVADERVCDVCKAPIKNSFTVVVSLRHEKPYEVENDLCKEHGEERQAIVDGKTRERDGEPVPEKTKTK